MITTGNYEKEDMQNKLDVFFAVNRITEEQYLELTNLIKAKDGTTLDITLKELDDYRLKHNVCEICGRTIEEATKWKSKFAPKKLCIDHDHNTLKFRGLLCSVCNRQLGWYEKYQNEIQNYLNK